MVIKWKLINRQRDNCEEIIEFKHDCDTKNGSEFCFGQASIDIWVSIFGLSPKSNKVHLKEVYFIPESDLHPVIHPDDPDKYYFYQNGRIISEIPPQNVDDVPVLEIYNRDVNDNQISSQVFSIKDLALDVNRKSKSSVDIVTEMITDNGESVKNIHILPYASWKSAITKEYKEYVFKLIDIHKNEVTIDLSKDSEDPTCFYIADGSKIEALTFMRFKIENPRAKSDPFKSPAVIERIVAAFKHCLTAIGVKNVVRLENDLLERFKNWNIKNTKYIAPIVALCQSSGSGKSKLSLELLKRNPGFYSVLRLTEQTGYPFKNKLSEFIYDTVKDYNDDIYSLEQVSYESCTVGKILDLIAQIITRYIHDIVELVSNGRTIEKATEILAERFQKNDEIDLKKCILKSAEYDMKKLYNGNRDLENDQIIPVKNITKYIKEVLENPERAFSSPIDENKKKKNVNKKHVCSRLAEILSSYPFIFVLDEADILARITYNQKGTNRTITGFEAFRRAVSYLEVGSKIMFLTLGTKSNVVDLNPVVIDTSSRFQNRKEIPPPIILTSNCNILSQEFPISELDVSYEMLNNPLFFKFLCTLGHGIWSSLPFDSIISVAETKLQNGSTTTYEYVLALWMILTEMSANPLSAEAGKLVANNMASLLEISSDYKKLLVMYPSEPILAIAANNLISKLPGDELFSILKKKFDAVSIDRGKIAEIFGGLIILRALAKSHSSIDYTESLENYQSRLDDLINLAPNFKKLWEKDDSLLESDEISKKRTKYNEAKSKYDEIKSQLENLKKSDRNSETGHRLLQEMASYDEIMNANRPDPCISFPNYKVTKLDEFLKTLMNLSDQEIQNAQIPSKVLQGIVNATHFVSLDRFSKGFKVDEIRLEANILPLADERIADKTRNVIDKALLKLALIRQCGIQLPPGYFGYDYLIPVCLEDSKITFVGIQIKRANADSLGHVFSMQARLHLIKCPNKECAEAKKSNRPIECGTCMSNEELDFIYKNQVSLLLSLDDEGNYDSFTGNITFFNGCTKASGTKLLKVLDSQITEKKINLPDDSKGDSFLNPLVHERIPLKNNVLLSKCLWDDAHISVAGIKKGKDGELLPFIPDGFIHRQFCLCSRGWEIFSRFLGNEFDSTVQLAKEILAQEGLVKNVERLTPDIIRQIVYDLSFKFSEYSEDLRLMRGQSSYLDSLEQAVQSRYRSAAASIKEAVAATSTRKAVATTSIKGAVKISTSEAFQRTLIKKEALAEASTNDAVKRTSTRIAFQIRSTKEAVAAETSSKGVKRRSTSEVFQKTAIKEEVAKKSTKGAVKRPKSGKPAGTKKSKQN